MQKYIYKILKRMNKMNRITLTLLISVVCLIGVYSCQDIIVRNIEDEIVLLLSPPDDLVTLNTTLTFWWEVVPDADKYALQIVSPRFDSIIYIALDTNISKNKFENLILFPGEFQWRVKAFNTSSETAYAKRNFTIDSTETVEQVTLLSPKDNLYTNDSIIIFTWSEQQNADSYRFKLLIEESVNVDVFVFDDTLIVPDEISGYDEFTEDTYIWQVQALNDYSQSIFTSRSFTIDWTAPGKPILQSPADEDTVSTEDVILQWQRQSVAGSPIFDSLYVYKDSINTIPIIDIEITGMEYQLTPAKDKKYFWRVKSIDYAGNEGDFSEFKWFFVEE